MSITLVQIKINKLDGHTHIYSICACFKSLQQRILKNGVLTYINDASHNHSKHINITKPEFVTILA